jgi:uncharacterized membrane protein
MHDVLPSVAYATLLAKAGTSNYVSHRTLVLGVGLALGVLVLALGVPLALKKVRPNRWYGLRAALAYESGSKWYRANRILGRALIVAGLVSIAATVTIWVAKPHALSTSNRTLAVVELVVVVVPAVLAYVYAYLRLGGA